jgi:ATP-binding cassette subfamily F protein 3
MVTLANIYVQFGDRILLDRVNLTIGDRDRIGLVGRNGAGKSTLLKILAGAQSPTEGSVQLPKGFTLGFLHQEMDLPKGKTVIDETMTAFAEVKALEKRFNDINQELAEREDYDSEAYMDLIEEMTTLSDHLHHLGGHTTEAEAEKVLMGLGFQATDMQRLTSEFSGGWQMRIELAKMLLQQPDLMLLDEPTNHLDIEAILWLEDWLQNDYKGAIILISHDREFLDHITNRTVEVELGKLHDYKAPYSKAMEMQAQRREMLESSYENQQKLIAQKERTITRFMAKASKTAMAQSMQKQLDKMDRIEIDETNTAVMKLRFPPAPRSGEVVIEAKNIRKEYGALEVLRGVDLKVERGDRIAFVGQNGQGKSTLAKIMVNELPPTSGEVLPGYNMALGYYAQNQSERLQPTLTLLQTMELHSPEEMRTRLRNMLGNFLFSGEDHDKKVSVLSGGERARLSLACMLLNPINLLVLDEPTNHLDMASKEVLKQAIQEFDGTLIVVSHDRDFLRGLTNRVVEFRDHEIYQYLGDIDAFLEKRALQNMRQVELGGSRSAKPETATYASAPGVEMNAEDKKRQQKLLQQIEKEIEQLEKKIKAVELEMAVPDFYTSSGSDQKIKEYQQLKKSLDEAMQRWEEAGA